MSLNAAAISVMVERGLSAVDILAVAQALETRRDPTAAERQARHREKVKAERVSVTRDVTRDEVTPPLSPLAPPDKSFPDPSKITPPIPPKPSSRGSRLPSNFSVPIDWIEWAMSKRRWSRLDTEDEGEIFVRYWQAKAGKEAVKLDWFKTWQNWVSNSRRQGAEQTGGGLNQRMSAPC